MIRGIGVDLLCLSRLHKLIGRRRAGVERLGKRILTPAELSSLPVHSDVDTQLRYLGVRYALYITQQRSSRDVAGGLPKRRHTKHSIRTTGAAGRTWRWGSTAASRRSVLAA